MEKQYTIEELSAMSMKKELLPLAKEFGIVGRHDMKKEELVRRIFEMEHAFVPDEAQTSANVDGEEKKEEKENDYTPLLQRAIDGKLSLTGELIAYRKRDDGKLTTGKIKSYAVEGNEIKSFVVENVRRKEHFVLLKEVVWFKLGKKWPSFVYNELKNRK